MRLKLNALSPIWTRRLQRLAASRTLLKTAVRGGVLRLSAEALTYGEGVLGSRNPRQVPVAAISAIDVETPKTAGGVRLHIRTADGVALEVNDVSPVAAARLRELIAIFQP
jgi:hypothetical protein